MITIEATRGISILLLDDFNSRLGLKNEFEYIYESELGGLYLEQDLLIFFFVKHGLLE